MLAGHDSTAMSLSWLLYDLARNSEDQKRVREEVTRVKAQCSNPDCLGVADFDSMTYTNAVIRVCCSSGGVAGFKYSCRLHVFRGQETLRLHPIAFMLPRVAAVDDVIPLATPIATKTGECISEIPIKEGQSLYLAVYTYNRLVPSFESCTNSWGLIKCRYVCSD